jgi:hypothetical protein
MCVWKQTFLAKQTFCIIKSYNFTQHTRQTTKQLDHTFFSSKVHQTLLLNKYQFPHWFTELFTHSSHVPFLSTPFHSLCSSTAISKTWDTWKAFIKVWETFVRYKQGLLRCITIQLKICRNGPATPVDLYNRLNWYDILIQVLLRECGLLALDKNFRIWFFVQ